jgi:hypothetical protein
MPSIARPIAFITRLLQLILVREHDRDYGLSVIAGASDRDKLDGDG